MPDVGLAGLRSFARYMEHAPAALAITCGPEHIVVYANAAFQALAVARATPSPGGLISDVFTGDDGRALIAVLDRVVRTGVVARNHRIGPADDRTPAWFCTVWPAVTSDGESCLVVELRIVTPAESMLATQREVADRMLTSALRERDAAAFLADEGHRLAEPVDEDATLRAIARLALPYSAAWCVVDILERETMRRLAIVHPDPAKQALLRELEERWFPEPSDPFGAPAMVASVKPRMINNAFDRVIATEAYDPETLGILRIVGVGALLTVPLIIRERLAGAITFVGAPDGRAFTLDDADLAERLATRAALALDHARIHGEAVVLRIKAEAANQAKAAFLASMSHELRTPLNAIGGYVDLIEMELHGPITEAQRTDLVRIRTNQRHLSGLIEDLLSLTKVGSGQLSYAIADIVVRDALVASVALVEPLIVQKQLACDMTCDATVVASADAERVNQILVNLLSNAIKFSRASGRIALECRLTEQAVLIDVSDAGIGVPADKLEIIFEPFVQVKSGLAGPDRGIGLGLSISRSLARAMHGDLTVESTLGTGSRFTLALPRAPDTKEGDRGTERREAEEN